MNILQKCEQVPELEDRARILRAAYLKLSGWDVWVPVSAFYEPAAVEMVLERGWWPTKVPFGVNSDSDCYYVNGDDDAITDLHSTLLEALTAALKGGE